MSNRPSVKARPEGSFGKRAKRVTTLRVRTRPERPVIIYDDSCGFCRDCVRWVKRLAPKKRFDYLKAADPNTQALFPELDQGELLSALHVVDPDGTVAVADEAVRQVLKRIPRFRFLALVWRLPLLPLLLKRSYYVVAARRGRACPARER